LTGVPEGFTHCKFRHEVHKHVCYDPVVVYPGPLIR
jgi:hypothetical protein